MVTTYFWETEWKVILISTAVTVSQMHDYSLTFNSCLLAKAVLQMEIDIIGASVSEPHTSQFNCVLHIYLVYTLCMFCWC